MWGYDDPNAHPNRKLPPKDMVFGTLTSMIEYIDALPDEGHGGSHDKRWAGGTHDQGRNFALNGWPEGAKLAGEVAGRIAERTLNNPSAASMSPRYTYDVAGAAYDPGAYLQGVPECWAMVPPVEEKRAIHIGINIIASGGVDESVLRTRGLAVAGIALALQTQGYPVTVDVLQAIDVGYDRSKRETVTCRVADASTGSPLDLDRVVYAMAHPTMLRRLFRCVTVGARGFDDYGDHRWGPSMPAQECPEGMKFDLFVGGAHLHSAERWADGGETWVMEEYVRQTQAK